MAVSRDLATVLMECETSDKFREFVVKLSLLTQQDVGLLESSEAAFETKTRTVCPPTEWLISYLSRKRGWLIEDQWIDNCRATSDRRNQLPIEYVRECTDI